VRCSNEAHRTASADDRFRGLLDSRLRRHPFHDGWTRNDRLVIEYDIGSKRKIRYAYSLVPETGQFLVETDLESGNKQSAGTMPVTRVYDSVVVP